MPTVGDWGDKTRKGLWGGENPKERSGPRRKEKGKRKREIWFRSKAR